MRLALGRLEYSVYLEYTIWLLENGLAGAMVFDSNLNAYVLYLKNPEDVTAFKLKFVL